MRLFPTSTRRAPRAAAPACGLSSRHRCDARAQVKQQLASEFGELRMTSADNLIYIKEDLLIPHHYSFYDLIVTKVRRWCDV